jgi:hypothetical protein
MSTENISNEEQGNGVLADVSTSSTNSELGSYHWFHTILARHKHMVEFLKDKTPSEEILRDWGKKLYETSQELINGYERINRD